MAQTHPNALRMEAAEKKAQAKRLLGEAKELEKRAKESEEARQC